MSCRTGRYGVIVVIGKSSEVHFHRDGVVTATWFSGTADEFVERCKASWQRGSRGGHFIGGSSVQLNGDKAFAESKLILTAVGSSRI